MSFYLIWIINQLLTQHRVKCICTSIIFDLIKLKQEMTFLKVARFVFLMWLQKNEMWRVL